MDYDSKQTSKSKKKWICRLTKWWCPNEIAENFEFWIQILSSQAIEFIEEITKKKLDRDDCKQIQILRLLQSLWGKFSFFSLENFLKNDEVGCWSFLLVLFSYLANICISLNLNVLIANMGKKLTYTFSMTLWSTQSKQNKKKFSSAFYFPGINPKLSHCY